jgi:hypothetical protein
MFKTIDPQDSHNEVCECCGRYVGQELKIGTFCYDPVEELGYMGPGVPLVFVFLQNIVITLLILILTVSLLGLVLNALSTQCRNGSECYSRNILGQIAIS